MDAIVLGITAVTVPVVLVVAGFLLIRWRRNKFRFSMRAMFLTIAVVACTLVVILQFVVPKLEHGWAVHQIHVLGGRVNFPEDAEQFERRYDPRRVLRYSWRDVYSIDVGGDQEAITVAKLLESIPELQQVRFHGVTDAGLEAICRLDTNPSLQHLDFYDSHITSTGLSAISNLKNIRGLFFNACQVDDTLLACLKSMPSLRNLWLLEEGKAAKPGRYTDKCFAEIGLFENLEILRLTNLQISDAAAIHLHNLKRLKKLYLNYCQMTDQAVDELRTALPECDIERYGNEDEGG